MSGRVKKNEVSKKILQIIEYNFIFSSKINYISHIEGVSK